MLDVAEPFQAIDLVCRQRWEGLLISCKEDWGRAALSHYRDVCVSCPTACLNPTLRCLRHLGRLRGLAEDAPAPSLAPARLRLAPLQRFSRNASFRRSCRDAFPDLCRLRLVLVFLHRRFLSLVMALAPWPEYGASPARDAIAWDYSGTGHRQRPEDAAGQRKSARFAGFPSVWASAVLAPVGGPCGKNRPPPAAFAADYCI